MAYSRKNLHLSKVRTCTFESLEVAQYVIGSYEFVVHTYEESDWNLNKFVILGIGRRLDTAIHFQVNLLSIVKGLELLRLVKLEYVLGNAHAEPKLKQASHYLRTLYKTASTARSTHQKGGQVSKEVSTGRQNS